MHNADLHRLNRSGMCAPGSVWVCTDERETRHGEQGFLLLGLVVAIFLILLALGVAAPKVARELRREQEVETIHRGNQYVRAIQLYYRKVGHYPGSIEQLEKTNNIRFLRHRYVDPMTGKDDWRLIPLGEAKTTVKGFFGQPLAGIASTGLGSVSGMASPGGTGSTLGSSSSGAGSSFGASPSGIGPGAGSSPVGGGPMNSSASSGAGGLGSTSPSGGIGSQSASDFKGSGGPFVGVGLVKDGDSITVLNEQTTYPTWEFIYDPRIEQMKAKASLFGGGAASTNASGLGSLSDMNSDAGKNNSGTRTDRDNRGRDSSSESSGTTPTSPQ